MRLESFVVYSEREFPRSDSITDFDIILSPQGSVSILLSNYTFYLTTRKEKKNDTKSNDLLNI